MYVIKGILFKFICIPDVLCQNMISLHKYFFLLLCLANQCITCVLSVQQSDT